MSFHYYVYPLQLKNFELVNELLSENAEQLLGVLPLTYSTVGNLVERLDKI